MSGDLVDDLHNAEDTIARQRAAIEQVASWRVSHPWTGLGDAPVEVREAITLGLFAGQGYCRPSCEGERGDWACGDDCACPGHAGDPTPRLPPMSYAPDIAHRVNGQAIAKRLSGRPRAKHRGCQDRTVILALAAIGHPCSTDHVIAVAGVDRSTAIRFLHEWMDAGVVRRHFDQSKGFRSTLDDHPVRIAWEIIDPELWP